MAKRKWWQYVLFFLRAGAKAAEDGDIGSGKKTAKAGAVAGAILDETGKIINAEDTEQTPQP